MSQNFKVLFLLKKGRLAKNGTLPIYARITLNGQRLQWSLQRSCEPAKWNQHKGRGIGNKADTLQLNEFLNATQGAILDIQNEYALRKEPIDIAVFRSRLIDKTEEKKMPTLFEVYQEHIEQVEKQVGSQFSLGTFKKFKSALKSLKSFVEWKYNKPDVSLSEVNHQFVTAYEFYLKTVQSVQHNSAMSNVKKLKKIVRMCVANEWITLDPFKSYRITTQETFRNYLLMAELEKLTSTTIGVDRLDQVKDIFVFSCYTGLSCTDLMSLTPGNLSKGIDGESWIFTNRHK